MSLRHTLAVAAVATMFAMPLAAASTQSLQITRLTLADVDGLTYAARGRPNEEARLAGLKAYLRGDSATAADHFRTAARYADKFSQHALSLMYWQGVGVPRDRVQAYIWADLAAERMSRNLLLVREKMWAEMTPAEQRDAVSKGEAFYAEYGDSAAQPRTEGAIRLFESKMVGSHIGFQRGRIGISGPPQGGVFGQQVGSAGSPYMNSPAPTAADLYGDGRRQFATYWRQQDTQLSGTVRTGALEDVQTSPKR